MNDKTIQAAHLPIEKLRSFAGNPFQVRNDDEMEQLIFSILSQGVLTPVMVRPLKNGEYEVISGHRRVHACKKAGINTVPALIYCLDRDEAAIALVDSNLHREHILPSEKAFAYKMKLEAMNRRGQRTDLTSSQVATKLDTAAEIGKSQGESRDKVYRYIRLTYLIPEILTKVDNGEIAMSPAVEISYLTDAEQSTLLDAMEQNDCTPSHAQAIRMKKLSQQGQLGDNVIYTIMEEEKPNQKEQIRLRREDFRKYFPPGYPEAKIKQDIEKALELLMRQRQRSRDAR